MGLLCGRQNSVLSYHLNNTDIPPIQYVTAKIGFSIDSDLHEKLLHRIGSIQCQNHVESNSYVFVSVKLFFCFPFRMIFLSVQKYCVQYYMAALSSKIGSTYCM